MQVIGSAICSSLPSKGVLLFSFLDTISDHKIKVVFYHPTIQIPPHSDHKIKVGFYHSTILIPMPHEARFWQKHLSTMWGSLIMIRIGFSWNYTTWRKPCEESSGWSCLNLQSKFELAIESWTTICIIVLLCACLFAKVIFWVSARSPTRCMLMDVQAEWSAACTCQQTGRWTGTY